MSGGKASWSSESTYLLQKCVQAVHRGERVGGTFTKKGWTNIHNSFNASSNNHYDMRQIKNRVLVLKREWSVWSQLKNETGLGWNPETETPDADEDWWKRMKEMKKGYDKFRYKPMEFQSEMPCVFQGVMAQGLYQMSQQTVQYDDDVYRPNLDDLEEGSGDSEEYLEPSPTGLLAGMQGFNMGSQRTRSKSGGKGKRDEGSSQSKRKTRRGPSADPDQSVLSRIAEVLESREERMRGKINDDEDDIPSVNECIKFLYTLDVIKEDA